MCIRDRYRIDQDHIVGIRRAAGLMADVQGIGHDVAEAYGYDGVSLMGYLAAKTDTVQIAAGILPIYTRTPTLLAMTAAGVEMCIRDSR